MNARKGNPIKEEDGELRYPEQFEIAYWRMHPNLQGWMEILWRNTTGAGGAEDFNCVEVRLSHADLVHLREDILKDNLPKTTGFFFGGEADKIYKEATLQAIHTALSVTDAGYEVVYYSWW